MKNLFILILVVLLVGSVYFFSRNRKKNTVEHSDITVVTSFYPLYFFTSEIGKERISVSNITPVGAEPHDYEPSTRQIIDLEKSRLVVINGVGLEPWADKLSPELEKKGIPVLAVASSLASQDIVEEGEPVKDPHIWLSPKLAKEEVSLITTSLISVDTANSSVYKQNAQILIEKLDALDKEFSLALSTCSQKNIVTSHAAFGYLAKDYGLHQIAIQGMSPEEEPSSQKMAEVTEMVKRDGITHIFFETLVSSRLAETIAKETGAKTLVFNPLEGLSEEEQKAGKDYFSIQRENLANLKIALQCK